MTTFLNKIVIKTHNKIKRRKPAGTYNFSYPRGPMLCLPCLRPAVSQVDDEDQLDEDEEQAARHPKVHPGVAEAAVGDKEGADPATDDQEVLDAPETILKPGPVQCTMCSSYTNPKISIIIQIFFFIVITRIRMF